MSGSLGTLCIVLHGHLPHVLNHGSHPHGEAWLFEAAAETYLPLLDIIGEIALLGRRAALTIGLTPVLLEQLAHERFKAGFPRYLDERRRRAIADRREFESQGEPQFASLAARWEEWHARALARFAEIGRDIPGEFARLARDGQIQILTSNATHCYMPLMPSDASLRAQMAAGLDASERRLRFRPTGMWLPECAYRPASIDWKPAVLSDTPRPRSGIEQILAESGITHFFVETQQVTSAQPMGILERGRFRPFHEAALEFDQQRAWRSPLEAVGVVSDPGVPKVCAFCRHPQVSEQVWSGTLGYPGDGVYLEFHKKHNERGLRYWRVTDNKLGLGEKQPYDPDAVGGKLFEQAHHFAAVVREVLGGYQYAMNRQGVVVASFDAELFGHWWFEGPRFLRDVILHLAESQDVRLQTAEEALQQHPPDKVMRLPEGSWGKGGHHEVWLNDRTRWMWEVIYRADEQFAKLLRALPWANSSRLRQLLERAGRQLLLLQASDWPFVVDSGGAVDYGIQRFSGHATSFDRLTAMAEELATGVEMSPLREVELADIDAHDSIFDFIDLRWWLTPA